MIKLLTGILITLVMSAGLAMAEVNVKNDALVILSTGEITAMEETVRFIEEKGGRIVHLFPTHILIGHIPKEIVPNLIGQKGILDIYYDIVNTTLVEGYGKMAVYAVEAWNRNYILPPKSKAKKIEGVPHPLINDARTIPESVRKEIIPLEISKALAPPYGVGTYDMSEYMIGKIAVGVILPESTGNQENWTSDEIYSVHSEIQKAMDWWANRESRAGLQFVYDWKGTVSTSYEPITLSAKYDEDDWVNDVMSNLGYKSGSHYLRVIYYNKKIQNDYKTDWAFTIFVVDSSNDKDGMFADADDYFAYAYLGGPFMVMTYDNDNYEIDNMDAVCAHETGHIFYALDEYWSASSRDEYAGYLWVQNGNHMNGGITNDPCIMRGDVSPFTGGSVCYYTRGQVGLWDNDNNGNLDLLDTGTVTLSKPIYNQGTTTLNYVGTATVLPPLENKNNEWNGNYYSHNDITVSSIANIQYKIDDGNWIDVGNIDVLERHPHNGTLTATFWFTTLPLTGGVHTITVRAVNSIGTPTQGYYSAGTVNLNLPPSPFSLIFPTNTTTISTLTANFIWGTTTASDYSTVTYTLWYGTDSTFNTSATKSLSGNTFSTTLVDNSTYYWKVYAVNKYGGWIWSNETDWRFYVNLFNEPPGTPSLISPSNGRIIYDLTPTFSWSDVFDPDPNDTITYELWYGKNNPNENKIKNITTTYYTLSSPLDNNSTYYWQVWAKDNAGSMTNSGTFTLTIRDIIIYPNPLYYSKDKQITFTYLPDNFIIKIFTITGELMTTITGNSVTGEVKWQPLGIASGIYLYVIESEGEVIKKGKLGIVR